MVYFWGVSYGTKKTQLECLDRIFAVRYRVVELPILFCAVSHHAGFSLGQSFDYGRRAHFCSVRIATGVRRATRIQGQNCGPDSGRTEPRSSWPVLLRRFLRFETIAEVRWGSTSRAKGAGVFARRYQQTTSFARKLVCRSAFGDAETTEGCLFGFLQRLLVTILHLRVTGNTGQVG